MASSSGATGALGLLALVALVVLSMQVTDIATGEWRRDYSLIWLLLATCAGIALLDVARAKRAKQRTLHREKQKELARELVKLAIQEIVDEFIGFISDHNKQAFAFKDDDWRREAGIWLTINNKYSHSPELEEWLAAAAKNAYWQELTDGGYTGELPGAEP